MSDDEKFMRRAMELAARGRGLVEPNPLVGAVVVRDSAVVGEGFHERFGAAHAEANALANAASAAHGATLFVTLEPCCHHGKTPPCTDTVIAAGIKRVVAAMIDPFEKVAGQGIARLRAAGIAVDVGLLEPDARRLNAPFLKLVSTGLPYVHAKWAMTLDGKIATASGDSKWISGEASRRAAHELRGRMDAIIVGIATVLADDPLLTARPPGPRNALRVVLDSSGRLPLTSHLARTARDLPVLIATSSRVTDRVLDELRALQCECVVLPGTEHGVSADALLRELGRRRLTNVLVEGGGRVLGSFHDGGLIDEIHVFVSAKTLGGATAMTAMTGVGRLRMADASEFEIGQIVQIENDCLIRAHRVSTTPVTR